MNSAEFRSAFSRIGGFGADGERVYGPGQLVRENAMHESLSLHPAPAGEALGDDMEPEVRLPLGSRAGVSGMLRGLVEQLQTGRLQSRLELGAYPFRDNHCRR